MLYNGFTRLLAFVIFFSVNLYNFTGIVINSYFYLFTTIVSNDSSILLHVLSSPTLTWWILFNTLIYFISLKSLFQGKIIVFALVINLNYFMQVQKNVCYIWTYMYSLPVNLNLQNGLLNVHPVIIYYLYGVCIWIWFSFFFIKKIYNLSLFDSLRVFELVKITIIGVLLGSLWAAQELNWGGFWSWDPVELSSLLLLFYLLWVSHVFTKFFIKLNYFLLLFIVIFVIYCLIRVGIVNTIHSFIRSNTLPLYIYVIIYNFLACVFFLNFYNIKAYATLYFKAYSNNFREKLCIINVIKLLLITLIFYLVYLIVNNSLFSIQMHITSIAKLYFNYIIICVYVAFIKKCDLTKNNMIIGITSLCLLNFNVFVICAVIILQLYKYKYKALHFIILFFVFVNHFHLYMTNVYYTCVNELSMNSISINPNDFFISKNCNYELLMFLKKTSLISHIKEIYSHVLGFGMFTNFLNSSLLVVKNYVYYYMFMYEVTFLIFCLFLLILITLNMDLNNNNKSVLLTSLYI